MNDYQKIGTNLRKLAVDELFSQVEAQILTVFKVPPIIVGSSDTVSVMSQHSIGGEFPELTK